MKNKIIGLIAVLMLVVTSAMAVDVSAGVNTNKTRDTYKLGLFSGNTGVTVDMSRGDNKLISVDLVQNFVIPAKNSNVVPYVGVSAGVVNTSGIDFKSGVGLKGQYGAQVGITVPTYTVFTPYVEYQWRNSSTTFRDGDDTLFAGVRVSL